MQSNYPKNKKQSTVLFLEDKKNQKNDLRVFLIFEKSPDMDQLRKQAMEEFRERLKKWMKDHNYSVEDVGTMVGVSGKTVYEWRSKAPVPVAKMRFLQKMMEEDDNLISKDINTQVILEFTPEQYVVVKAEAERRGLTVEEWAAEVLHSLASVTVRVRA